MAAIQKSRIGKKQICCYVSRSNQLNLMRYAKRTKLTYQQAMANFINAYCKSLNEEEVLPKFELFPPQGYRKNGVAEVRRNASNKGRRKLVSVSGWYKRNCVDDLIEIAERHQMTLQDFCSTAISIIGQETKRNKKDQSQESPDSSAITLS